MVRQKGRWFQSFLKLDKKFEAEGRKIVLITDNCLAHPVVENFKSTDFFFFAPNTISFLQLKAQALICSLKSKYRNRVIQKLIDAIGNDKLLPAILILEAMKIQVMAWNDVAGTTKLLPQSRENSHLMSFELMTTN